MHPSENRILVIDDNPAIHGDYKKVLCPQGETNSELNALESLVLGAPASRNDCSSFKFEMDSALSGQAGLDMVKKSLEENRPYSTAFVDMRMGRGWDGVETIKQIWAVYPDLQVVICTAHSDYSWNEVVNVLGRTDKLVILRKPFENVEVLQLALSMSHKWKATRHAQAQLQTLGMLVSQRTMELERANHILQLEEKAKARVVEHFHRTFHATPLAMAIVNAQKLSWVDVNESFTDLAGSGREDLMNNIINVSTFWADQPASLVSLLQSEQTLRGVACEFKSTRGLLKKVCVTREFFQGEESTNILLILHDVTDQQLVQEQIREVVRLEAIGRLAASAAHDFNDVLTVVQGSAGMLLNNEKLPEACRMEVQQIVSAAQRATGLVRHLSTFGTKKALAPEPINLAEQVELQARTFARLFGEQTRVEWNCAFLTPNAMVDRNTLDQILLNLVINARDAMKQGGTITISTRTATVDEAHAARMPDARQGRFALLQVDDTGTGLDPALQNSIFEPILSPRVTGEGAGLGLATVYSLVKEQQGWVEVDSVRDVGTTFSVYLPATDAPAVQTQPTLPASCLTDSKIIGMGHSALVVEDDESIRSVLKQLLRRNGFNVFEASSGQQALSLWQERQNDISLVITDLVMPGVVNGLDVGRRISQERPKVKMVYSSGYDIDMLGSGHGLEVGRNYLPKPYDDTMLTQFLGNIFTPAQAAA